MFRATALRGPVVAAIALAAGCSTGSSDPSETLTITGSGEAPPAAARPALAPPLTGDPAEMLVGMYALYISPNEDCSEAVLVQDYGATAEVKDFMQNPVLFSGTPPAGAYKCVAFKMSDVLRMRPATTFGVCNAGTEYSGDIYREGETDWVDVDGNPIVGSGTDDAPADDRVTIFLTRNPGAALARGISGNQIVQLGSDLVVPGQSTFYWNGQGSVVDDSEQGGGCSLEPGQPEFR